MLVASKSISWTSIFTFLQLGQLTGVAATLRFPMPDLDDLEDDDDTNGAEGGRMTNGH